MTIIENINKHAYPILLTLFTVWMCVGIVPLLCYETDGQEIILGCDILHENGWQLPPVYSYEYRMQPLTTVLIVALENVLPILSSEQYYCLLTVVATLVFLMGCVTFVAHVTKASKTLILVAAMLLPEVYAIAMYPNTAIPALACFVWALNFMSSGRYLLSGVLMCVAILFRLDVVIVFPAILPLLLFEGKTIRQTIQIAAVYVAVVVVVALCLFWVMGAEPLGTYGGYQKWNNIITPLERILAIVGFYSLVYLVLLPLGLYAIAAKRQWKTLLLVVFPILLLHGVYAQFGNASKHFLYNAPFVIIAGVWAITWLRDHLTGRPILKWGVLAVGLLLMTVSVRKQDLSMPWLKENPLHQAGMVLPLYTAERGNTAYTIGIGAGYQLITNDEYMLLSGHLFYPWYINDIKHTLKEWREEQFHTLNQDGTTNILTLEWGVSAPVSIDLMESGQGLRFRQDEGQPETYCYTLTNASREQNFHRIIMRGELKDSQQALAYIDSVKTSLPQGINYVMAASNHYGSSHILDELATAGSLEKKGARIYQIIDNKEP